MNCDLVDPSAKRIADFLAEIGLEIVCEEINDETFLPGILVRNGRVVVDKEKLAFPGDLLHEAGHLALAPGAIRSTLSGEVAFPGVQMEPVESSVMAWSYAAALYLEVDPKIVFHNAGYRGASDRLLFNFSVGAYIGVNGLQDAGLTITRQAAIDRGIPPYPHMIKWLRD